MHLMRRPFGPLAGLLLAFLGLCALAATAQAQTSSLGSSPGSSDPFALLQGLSPTEQQAILGRISGAGNLGTGTSELNNFPGALGAGQGRQGQLQLLEQQMAIRQRRLGEEQPSLIPVLRGGDWVIVEIGFQLPPRPASETALALQQAYGAPGRTASLSPQNLQALQALQGSSGGNAGAALAQASTAVTPASQLSAAEKQHLASLMDLIRARNPYQLSPDGELILPGFAPIPLLGLTQDQATLRLSVVPAFQSLEVRVTRLPLKKTGEEALKGFGYDIFSESPMNFEPLSNIPVPSNYLVGPGDVINVLLYGSQNHA